MQRPIDLVKSHNATGLVFERSSEDLQSILSDDDSLLLSLDLLGKPLVIHNIEKVVSIYDQLDSILLPSGSSAVAEKIAETFPKISIKEYAEQDLAPRELANTLKIPTNSVITKSTSGGCEVDKIEHPWDITRVMERVLETEVKASQISADSSVAETTIIDGPCIVEAGAQIDSFCKIKGPLYIGSDARIGTGSLVRASMVGKETIIGFSCEIGKSYLGRHVTIPHLDVILDSVVGQNTWMGAFVGTTNMMLNYKNVMYKENEKLIDTGLQHFGAIIGHDCTIGAGTLILPGRYVPPRTFIAPNAVFSSSEKTGH